MNVTITLTKQEVAEAVRVYVFERASTGYKSEFSDAQMNFLNNDGDLGYFTCVTEVKIKDREK